MAKPISRKAQHPKREGPDALCKGRSGPKKQSLNRHCFTNNPRKQRLPQDGSADFATTPLGRAAEAREWAQAPYHVNRIAARHGLSVSLAGAVAELAGIGPRGGLNHG